MNRAKEYINKDIKLKYRIKGAVQYIVYGKFAGMKLKNLVFSRGGGTIIKMICVFPALIVYFKWKKYIEEV